jgi:hypothetical protein
MAGFRNCPQWEAGVVFSGVFWEGFCEEVMSKLRREGAHFARIRKLQL